MSVSPSAPAISAIVSTLRAAGCVFAEDEAQLLVATARTPDELATLVDRRVAGLPLEHVLGWAEFCGLRIVVDPGVFVPRRRTEFLVHHAAELVRLDRTQPPTVVVDLCCGSGALGLALTAALSPAPADAAAPGQVPGSPPVDLYAADIDPAAVRCARRNVAAAGGQVYEGDLYEPLPSTVRGRVDVLLANVPYVPTDEVGLLPPEARLHEPRVALDGGADGLDIMRRVAAEAPHWLAPGGHVLVETSERQAPTAVDAFARVGLVSHVAASEEFHATVVVGTRPAG